MPSGYKNFQPPLQSRNFYVPPPFKKMPIKFSFQCTSALGYAIGVKDLIIGTVSQLEYEKLAPFFESLRSTGSEADVCIFVADTSPETVRKIEAMGVTVIPFFHLRKQRKQPLLRFWPLWKRILRRLNFKGKCVLGKKVFSLFTVRSVLAYEFIEKRQHLYRNVLLTDVRDVFFQRDPFALPIAPGLHCFLETPRQIIGKCRFNKKMVESALGTEVLQKIGDNVVSCAGTVMGDPVNILSYLRTMIETFGLCRDIDGGNDQGIHNYLIYTGQLPNAALIPNDAGLIYTAGFVPYDEILFNENNEVIHADGSVVPVVHQYDRHPKLIAFFAEKLKEKAPALKCCL